MEEVPLDIRLSPSFRPAAEPGPGLRGWSPSSLEQQPMDASASLVVSVMEIASGLRDDPPSYVNLNRAAGRIDHLGRLLHGLGCVRHREIAACFMAAIGELQSSTELPEPIRTDRVARAVTQLEAARVHLSEGTTAVSRREEA